MTEPVGPLHDIVVIDLSRAMAGEVRSHDELDGGGATGDGDGE